MNYEFKAEFQIKSQITYQMSMSEWHKNACTTIIIIKKEKKEMVLNAEHEIQGG